MSVKKLLNNNTIQIIAVVLAALGLSYGIIKFYWVFVTSNYIKLLILYLGSMLLFAGLGFLSLFKYKKFNTAVPLFIVSFCWIAFYLAQVLSGVDLLYDFHVRISEEEKYEELKESKRPDAAKTLLAQGKSSLENGELFLAKRELFAALDLDNSNADIYFSLGDLYTKFDIPDTALNFFQLGLQRDFNRAEIHAKIGQLSYKLGRIDVAIQAYSAAVQFDSTLDVDQSDLQTMLILKTAEDQAIKNGMVRVSQIVLNTREEAQKILTMLDKGTPFTTLAYKYSIDPAAKSNGGILPFMDPEKREYTFINRIAGMKIGEVSEILQSEGKYFLLKRIN